MRNQIKVYTCIMVGRNKTHTMCPPGYYQSTIGFRVTLAFCHLMYG